MQNFCKTSAGTKCGTDINPQTMSPCFHWSLTSPMSMRVTHTVLMEVSHVPATLRRNNHFDDRDEVPSSGQNDNLSTIDLVNKSAYQRVAEERLILELHFRAFQRTFNVQITLISCYFKPWQISRSQWHHCGLILINNSTSWVFFWCLLMWWIVCDDFTVRL